MLRRTWALAAALTLLACVPSTALATQSVKLSAGFSPDRPGASTTISFGFQISAEHSQIPSPLTGIDLRYPADLGLGTSDLGLATCLPSSLQIFGPAGCPANSRMGYGSAFAEIPIGPVLVGEPASITLLAGPAQEGHLDFLVYALAEIPVYAQIIFSALLLPEPAPFGGRLHFDVPLVPSLPEAPDVAVVRLRTTLGSRGLTYYERVHGKTIAYRPNGILLPSSCPRGGFPFAANLSFQDGTHAHAATRVPCPGSPRGVRRHG
jgi:hypothetical protein